MKPEKKWEAGNKVDAKSKWEAKQQLETEM